MHNVTEMLTDGPSRCPDTSEATQLIHRIRTSPPSRKVQDGRSNVTGRYPSHKMGHTIQFESHKVELAFIREYEFDAGVLEYYDQPGPIKISYRTNSGRKTVAFTTPDFFVIRSDGTAGWEECKPEQDLERLAEKSERFVRDDNGKWRCPPGEEHAAKYGFYFRIAPYLSGAATSQPSSTVYNWLNRYREAEIRYGYGYLGLLDRKSERGNRLPKLPKESYDLMETSIDGQYLTSTEISPTTVYGHYRNLCKKSGVVSASFKTFMKKLKQLDIHDTLLSRQGARAAYQVDVFYWELEFTTPRHGDRPFEIAHLDHTELDIEVVDSMTGSNLGRPWLTLMNDANSRRVLAWILSFEPPSYRSCMLVMRECVRIHGRLPQTIVVDRGADFNSVYFEQLLAMHGITKKERPGAKPRYGSVLERLFGMTNQRFVHALRGNTKIMRNVRQVTKSVNPANLAVWTLPKLQERIGRYFSEVYDGLDHPALGESPGNAFMRGLSLHGMRSMKLVRYDSAFILSTLPSTPKGHAKVIRSRGVKINNFYYWHENLRFAAGTDVAIRYDPYDVATAYAFVKGQWLCCHSQYYAILQGHSEKEVALITLEIIKKRSNHSRKIAINAQIVAAFIAESQGIELELKGMRQAAEMRIRNPGQLKIAAPEPVLLLPESRNTSKDFETYDELTI